MTGRQGKKAQVSLEMAMAVFLSLILLMGIFKVFIWLNARMVMLQQDYEKNRGPAGSGGINSQPIPVNQNASFPALDIFGNTPAYRDQSK